MTEKSDFDLKKFQSEVYKDFIGVQMTFSLAQLEFKSLESKGVKVTGSTTGLLIRAGLVGFRALAKRSIKSVETKPDFDEKEIRAARIFDDPKIKNLLCPRLRAEILPDLPIEAMRARMVRIVTCALLDTEPAEEFSIEKDVRFFSLLILKIWQKGIVAYCLRNDL